MTRRSKLWWSAAGIYMFVNVAGAPYAFMLGEEAHGTLHVVLALLGVAAYVGWRVARRGPRQDLPRAELAEERVEYLQQSVDAMALELERLGEAQRYRDKLQAAQGQTPPLKKEQ
jgi:hypothetical protein